MGHRTRKHRASRAVDAAGRPLIRPLPQLPRAEPVTLAMVDAYQPPAAKDRAPKAAMLRGMLRTTKGARKWIGGLPTVHYSREGYVWVKGEYIKMPKATGITLKYSKNRHQRRADAAHFRQQAGR